MHKTSTSSNATLLDIPVSDALVSVLVSTKYTKEDF